MSFVAAVVAKKGVAIIADSLEIPEFADRWATSIIHEDEGADTHGEQTVKSILASPSARLYAEQFYLEEHAEKIFQLDQFTCIVMTRIIAINDKSMRELVETYQGHIKERAGQPAFAGRLNDFRVFLDDQIKAHMVRYQQLEKSTLLMAGYDPQTMRSSISRIRIRECKSPLPPDQGSCLSIKHQSASIIHYGQSRICPSIIQGFQWKSNRDLPHLVRNIIKRLRSPDHQLPGAFLNMINKDPFYRLLFARDLKYLELSSLNIQQAVDLASLLMRLEIDLFKVTHTRPQVGGTIQLAAITEKGFHFIR
jgi:hypothetical protein